MKKTLSFFIFGSLTLILGAISAALYFIDWNQYRDTLAALASERLGVQVELAGDLSLNFLPRPALSAQAVRLSPGQANFNDTIATADRIDMHLGLAALLRGSAELQSLAFDGLSANLVETPTGWMIEGWPATDASTAEGNSSDTLLSLDRFRIQSGSISVRPLNAAAIVFDGLDLSLAGRLPTGPLDWNGSAVVAGEPVTVSGKIVPTRTAGATSVRAAMAVADNQLEFSGRLSDGGEITGRLKAGGQSLRNLALFINRALGQQTGSPLPSLPFTLDMQIDRDGRGVSRLISRQFSLGTARGAIDLTLAEHAGQFHVTGTGSIGVIALDDWLSKLEVSAEGQAPEQVRQIPLFGSIDLSIEGIEYRNNRAQQIEAVISFNGGSPSMEQFGALLPGASRFAYSRREPGIGSVQFQSGGLQEVLDWLDLPLSEEVPAGRLRTADLNAVLSVVGDTWVLSTIDGTIDTSAIEAELSGTVAPFVPNAIKASIDQLNLDAYWPQARLPDASEHRQNLDVQFDVSVGALQWLGQSFDNVVIAGRSDPKITAITKLKLGHLGGMIEGGGEYQPLADNASDIEGSLKFSDWQLPILAYFVPEYSAIAMAYSLGAPVSGQVDASGPLTALQARGTFASNAGALEIAGTLNLSGKPQGRMQGSARHRDVRQLLARLTGWIAPSEQPIEANMNLTFEGSSDQFSFSAAGALGGGQANTTGQYGPNGLAIESSVVSAAGEKNALDTLVSRYGVDWNVAAPRRLRFEMTAQGPNWTMRNLDVRNGEATLSGSLSLTDNVLAGALMAKAIDVAHLRLDQENTSSRESLVTGTVGLALQDISWMGQSLTAPNASVMIEDETLVLSFGTLATLNGAPLVAEARLASSEQKLSASIRADALDIGGFMATIGTGRAVSGSIAGQVDLTADYSDSKDILTSLSGQGQFEGGAGSLYFIDVPNLIRSVSNSENTSGFLQSVGTLLRSGTTDFAHFKGAFRLDNGVALVDELIASGDWGQLALDGQINLPGDYINLAGQLAVSRPADTPSIPVVYEGKLSAPDVRWTSRAIEQFAIAGIERRLRTKLFGELDKAQAGNGDQAAPNPGSAVFQIATGLLTKLRVKQAERKRLEEEQKQEPSTSAGTNAPGFEGQMP